MSSIYIYTKSGNIHNIVDPFVTSGVYINPQYYIILSNLVKEYYYNYDSGKYRVRDLSITNCIKMVGAFNRLFSIHKYRKLPLPFIVKTKTEFAQGLNREGVVKVYRNIKTLEIEVKSELIVSDWISREEYDQIEIDYIEGEKDSRSLGALIAIIYASFIRYNWLRIYTYDFPLLDLTNNSGTATPKHLEALVNLQMLPYFYIWDKAIKFTKEYCIKNNISLPNWYNQEIKSYGHFDTTILYDKNVSEYFKTGRRNTN